MSFIALNLPPKRPANQRILKPLCFGLIAGDCRLTTILWQQYAQIARRWQHGSYPLHLCHFGGTSRASRRHKMTIRRLAPSHPPDNSAEVLQNVQFVQ